MPPDEFLDHFVLTIQPLDSVTDGKCLQGDKVKLVMRFKGREMDFRDEAKETFEVSPACCTIICLKCQDLGRATTLPKSCPGRRV